MKKGLFLILAIFLALTVSAQHRRIPYYGFARFDRNRIQYPSGKSPDFDLFLRKLDTVPALDAAWNAPIWEQADKTTPYYMLGKEYKTADAAS